MTYHLKAKLHCIIAILLFQVFGAEFSYSQVSQGDKEIGTREAEQILRQQRRFIEEEEIRLQKDRLNKKSGIVRFKPTLPKQFNDIDQDFCMQIEYINFIGANSLYKRDKIKLSQDHLGKCLKIGQIFTLLNEINNYYINKGLVAARSYISPNQSIKSDTLNIIIHEGIIEDIKINDNSLRNKLERSTAFPLMQNQPLDMRDIEQGLDQINRLSSNDATLDIKASETKVGHSQIIVKNKTSNRIRGSAGFDNQCTDSTGRNCYRINIEQDNLFALNDQIFLSLSKYAGGQTDKKDSRSAYLSFSIPFGYWTGQLSASNAKYHSTINGDVVSFKNSGTNTNYNASLERLISRSAKHKTSIKTSLELKDNESFIRDVRNDSASRKLSVLTLGFSHYQRNSSGFNLINLDYLQGVKLFNSQEDEQDLDRSIPRAQYEALKLYFNNYKYFKLADYNFTNSLTVSGQYSRHALFGSEQFTIGDPFSVRGFRNGAAFGDHGAFIKNDLYLPVPSSKNKVVNQIFKNTRPFIGLDAGFTGARDKNSSNNSDAHLVGITAGISKQIRIGKFALNNSLSYSRAIKASNFVKKNNDEIYFKISLQAL